MRVSILRSLLAALILATASGCAAVTAVTGAATPLDAFALTPPPAREAAATGRVMNVEVPTASGAIDTDRILVKPSTLQAQYLPGVRWVDPVPALVQSLLVASLQDSGAFRHVGRPQLGPFPDYTLFTEIRAFEAEATAQDGAPYRIRVTLVVSLVREADNIVVATRTFSGEAVSETIEPGGIVPAFDRATDQVLADVVAWVLARFGLAA